MDKVTQGSTAALPPGQLGGGSVAIAGASLNNALTNMFTLINLQNKLKALGITNSMNDAQLAAQATISAGASDAQGMRINAFGSLTGGAISLGSSGIAGYTQYQAGVQGSKISDPAITVKNAYDQVNAAEPEVQFPNGGARNPSLTPEKLDRFKNFTPEEATHITPSDMRIFKRDFPIGSDERTAFEGKLTKTANGTSAEHKIISESARSTVQITESVGQGLSHLSSGTTGFMAASSASSKAKKDANASLFQASSQAANAAVGVNDSAVQSAEQIVKIIAEAYNQLAAVANR